jgi:hypothetical protein
MKRPRLSLANQRFIEQNSNPMGKLEKFSRQLVKARDQGIAKWYQEGGDYFLQWARQHYRRWTGEPLQWNEPWLEEMSLLMGNPWVETIIAQKAAQMGYTELCVALIAFILAEVRVSCAFGVEQASKLRDIVAPRVQPAFDYTKPIVELKKARKLNTKREDTDTKDRKITVGGVPCTFFYVSTAAAKNTKEGERQASSAVSSYEAFVNFVDEVELYPEGVIDVLRQRQNACTMLSKIMRMGSTPGAEGGTVDTLVKTAKYDFRWFVKCPHCDTDQPISPFGNFLIGKIITIDDITEERFVDVIGKPYDWFAHDKSSQESAIATAFVGCSHCKQELVQEIRFNGRYKCQKSGIELKDFLEQITKDRTVIHETVAINFPKLASNQFTASERIRRLIESKNATDELQQGLGLAVFVGAGKIRVERLLDCVGLAVPEKYNQKPDFITMGVDQGKAVNFVTISRWYYPPNVQDPVLRWQDAFQEIVFYGEVPWGEPASFDSLTPLIEEYEVDVVGMDVDPEFHLATNFGKDNLPCRKPDNRHLDRNVDKYPDDLRSLIKLKEIDLNLIKFIATVRDYEIRQKLLILVHQEKINLKQLIEKTEALIEQKIRDFPHEQEALEKCKIQLGQVYQPQLTEVPSDVTDLLNTANISKEKLDLITKIPYRSIRIEMLEKAKTLSLNDLTINVKNAIARKGQVILCDQVILKGKQFVQKTKTDATLFSVYRTFGLDNIRDRIYRQLISFPLNTGYNAGDPHNFLYHFTTPNRLTDGTWTKAEPDHYFHSANFGDLALRLYTECDRPKRVNYASLLTSRDFR